MPSRLVKHFQILHQRFIWYFHTRLYINLIFLFLPAICTLSMEGILPSSICCCKKSRMSDTGQFSRSRPFDSHHLSNTAHLQAYRHLVEGARASVIVSTMRRDNEPWFTGSHTPSTHAVSTIRDWGSIPSRPPETVDPASVGSATGEPLVFPADRETKVCSASTERLITLMPYRL